MNILPRFTSALVITAMIALGATEVLADPCLTVYPAGETYFYFDPAYHTLVDETHREFDPSIAIYGLVLIERKAAKVAYDIHQAPHLRGFIPASSDPRGFMVSSRSFQLIVDGFSNRPTTFDNVTLIVETQLDCPAGIWIDGTPLENGRRVLGDLQVSTPAKGNNYSDVLIVDVIVEGCGSVEIWAFADEDENGERDGGECFSAFGRDFRLPVRKVSWGGVKESFGTRR